MAASVDAASHGVVVDGLLATWNHTISASATLVVIVAAWAETTPSVNGSFIYDITVNGTSCTFNSQVVNGYILETWYLASPPTGVVTIVATWADAGTGLPPTGGKVTAEIGSVSFLSTDTSFPIVRTTSRTDNQDLREIICGGRVPNRVMAAVTTLQGSSSLNFLVDGIVAASSSFSPTVTVDANQTERWNGANTGADGTNMVGAGSTRGGLSAKVPMRWALSNYVNFAHTVVEVKGV